MKRITLLPILIVLAAGRPSGGPVGAAETVAKVPQGSEETIRSLIGEYLAACRQIENERGMHPSHRRGHTRQIRAEVRLQVALCHTPNVAGILIPMLDHANAGIRRIAAKALAEISPDEKASAPMIAKLLGGKHAPVVVKALARIGPGATAVVSALERALHDDPKLRPGVCDALASIGSPAVDVLTKALGAEDASVRAAAAMTLGRIHPLAAPARKALVRLLNDKQAAIRLEAAETLGRMGPAARNAATALTGALKDADAGVRLAAARALRRIDPATGGKAIAVLTALLKDPKPEIRQDAACALAAHGAAAIGAVPALVRMLKDSPRASVKAAATALVLIGPKPADVTAALREALKHPRVEARVVMADVLHHFDPKSTDVTVPVLLAALKTQYGSYEKLRAVRVLGKIGAPAVGGLMKMFDKANTNSHRWMAAMALAEIGKDATPATDMLIVALDEPKQGDYHHHVRNCAARALGRIGARKDISVPILTRMLQDRYVRRGAAEALHRLDPDVNTRHMDIFVKALDRGDWWKRRDAAEALGRMGPAAKDAVGALLRLEYDTDATVRTAALEAVRKIRGRDLPPLSLTAEAALPGSWLSLAGAMRDGYDFIAVCQAPRQADVMNETGRLGMAAQPLTMCKALAARAQVVSEIDVAYLYPRYSPRRWLDNDGELVHSGAVARGRRLIWVIREIPTAGPLTRKRRHPAYLGVKAIRDTPENRAAVVKAVKAVAAAKPLRANLRNFKMTLAYRGPKPRDYIRLTLTAALPLPKPMPPLPPWEQHVHIDEKQAAKIIDHLVESGSLARADCVSPYRRTILKVIPGPAYVLTVTGGGGWLFRDNLGWDPAMLNRLDALRKVLDGWAAKAMDKLLKKLDSQRKKWQQDACVGPASVRPPMPGHGTNRADGSSLVKLPAMVGVNAAVAGKQPANRTDADMSRLLPMRVGLTWHYDGMTMAKWKRCSFRWTVRCVQVARADGVRVGLFGHHYHEVSPRPLVHQDRQQQLTGSGRFALVLLPGQAWFISLPAAKLPSEQTIPEKDLLAIAETLRKSVAADKIPEGLTVMGLLALDKPRPEGADHRAQAVGASGAFFQGEFPWEAVPFEGPHLKHMKQEFKGKLSALIKQAGVAFFPARAALQPGVGLIRLSWFTRRRTYDTGYRIQLKRADKAAERAKLLKQHVGTFRLTLKHLNPHGPNIRPVVRLTVAEMGGRVRTWRISKAQAVKLIDHLAAEGFLASSENIVVTKAAEISGPCCVLSVGGPPGVLLEENMGWDLTMLQRLDALRKVLDGDAAKAMDRLLEALAPQRKKWQAQAQRDVKRREACLAALREIRKGFAAIVRKYPKGFGHLGPGQLDEKKLFLRFPAKTLPKATPAMRATAGRSRPRLLRPQDCGMSFHFTTPMSPKVNAGQWLHVNVGLVLWWMWPNRGLSTEMYKDTQALVRRAVAGLDALEDAAVAAGAASRGKGPYTLRGRPGVKLTIRLSPKPDPAGTAVDIYATNETRQAVALCPPFWQIIRNGKPWHAHAHGALWLGATAVLGGVKAPFTTIEPGRSAKVKSEVVAVPPGRYAVRIAADYLRDYWVDLRPTFADGPPAVRKVPSAWTGALVSNELTVQVPAPAAAR